jgi:hypothetical protein
VVGTIKIWSGLQWPLIFPAILVTLLAASNSAWSLWTVSVRRCQDGQAEVFTDLAVVARRSFALRAEIRARSVAAGEAGPLSWGAQQWGCRSSRQCDSASITNYG